MTGNGSYSSLIFRDFKRNREPDFRVQNLFVPLFLPSFAEKQILYFMRYYIFYILAIFAAMSCAQKVTDSEIFNGEIKIIDDTVTSIIEMQGKEIILDGITYGIPAVYDSLLFFHIDNLPDAFYVVFNLKTGKELGYFCPKGQGNNFIHSVGRLKRFSAMI
jgi:hypothetical protein